MLFDNLGLFCLIVELWPVLNPPNVVVDVTFGLIYLVTFKKVYLKAAAFVRYQILILHVCHVSPGSSRRVPWSPGAVPAVHPPRVRVRRVAQLQLETRVNTNTVASREHVAPGRSSGGSPRPPSTTRRPCRSRVRAWRSPPPGAAPTPGWGGHGDLASYHALMHLSRPTN